MKTEHAYWLAAAIDGEGCILIRHRGRNDRVQIGVVVANQDMRFLDFARDICGCGNVYDGKRCKQLRIERTEDVIWVLTCVAPYLVIKGDRAREAISMARSQEAFIPKRVSGRFAV